ncbi:MAG: hypothetical protein QOJ12_1838 [Thermoleophilales bacterium]|jgi:hypothetical protein|nr:hypothetical protein [Thermoleophilales bacterium]
MRKILGLVASLAALALLALPGAALAKGKDADHDKLPDRWEKQHGLSTKKKDAALDPDKDGLSNLGEYRASTDPQDADTDNDGIGDADEDGDRDKLDNASELDAGTNPRKADTDRDRVKDGAEDSDGDGVSNADEDASGSDPGDADSDDDGIDDGDEHVGAVTAWDPATSVLTISVAGGTPVSAKVTANTEIGCETEHEHESQSHGTGTAPAPAARRGADDQSPGDDHQQPASGQPSGSGDDEPGDQSGQADDGDAETHGDEDNVCGVADLAVGVRVHEAHVSTVNGELVFDELQIVK